MMGILEEALQIVEEVESHSSDLDEYDVVRVASQIALIESVDYSFDPRVE